MLINTDHNNVLNIKYTNISFAVSATSKICWQNRYQSFFELLELIIDNPANTIHCPNADLMLGHRLRRWPNLKSELYQGFC